MKTEQENILEILLRLEETKDCSWSELAIATALEYGRKVRNQTLEEAAAKVKELSAGLECRDCDSCTARRNDVATILEMRTADSANDKLSESRPL